MDLKVYGGLAFCRVIGVLELKQYRTIIAARSLSRAANLVGESHHTIKTFWAVSVNEEELEVALRAPGVVFIKLDGKFVRRRSVI